jgi:hypothetical protein
MIHVEISLWPGGDKEKASHLGTILIANDESGTLNSGNYVAVLSQAKKPATMWKTSIVKGFPRKRLGAYDLLYRILKDVVGERND